MMKIGALNIKYETTLKVIYLGWKLDNNQSGEAMALKVINKINGRLRFLYRKKQVLIAVSENALM